jgi:hypothetical protein
VFLESLKTKPSHPLAGNCCSYGIKLQFYSKGVMMDKKEFIQNKVIEGAVIGLLWALFNAFLKGDSFFEFTSFNPARFLQSLIVAAIVFPLGGLILGVLGARDKK